MNRMPTLIEKIEAEIKMLEPVRKDQYLTAGYSCILKEYEKIKKEIRCYDKTLLRIELYRGKRADFF